MIVAVICPYILSPLSAVGLYLKEETRATGTINLSIGLAKLKGIEVHQLSLSSAIDKNITIVDQGVNVHYIKIPKYLSSLSLYQIPRILVKRKIKEIGPDIVHGHHAELGSTYFSMTCGFPSVAGIHNFIPDIIKWQNIPWNSSFHILRYFEKRTLKKAKVFTVDSSYMQKLILPYTRNPIHVIPNCIGESFFEHQTSIESIANPTLLFIGSHRPEKGLITLLNALTLIRKEIPGCKIKIIGEVSPGIKTELYSRIKQNDLINNVIFLGWMDWESIINELTTAMALIVPSLHEPFGCVVAEGMAVGTPVVGARIGGIIDSIEDEKTGMLFEPGNSVDLAEKVIRLIQQPDLRISISKTGREYAKSHFHPHIVALQHKELYEDILKEY